MRSILSLFLGCTLLAGLAPVPSSPAAQDRGPTAPVTKSGKAAVKKLRGRLQGAWRLTEMHLVSQGLATLGDQHIEQIGFALFHDDYLSIEFHMRLTDKLEQDWGMSLVSGLHRYELDPTGLMQTSSLISTRTRKDGSPSFDPPGSTRNYQVSFEGEKLTEKLILTRDDGHRLEFERLLDDRSRFDIFGRKVHEPEDAEEPATGEKDGGSERKDEPKREKKQD